MIHILTGLPTSGKSEVTDRLVDQLKGVRVNTDLLVNNLFPINGRKSNGDFTDEALQTIYDLLPYLAEGLTKILPEKHVIFEGTFRKEEQRTKLIEKIKTLGRAYQVILISADRKDVEERIEERKRQNKPTRSYSELSENYEPPAEGTYYCINTSCSWKELDQKVSDYIDQKCSGAL